MIGNIIIGGGIGAIVDHNRGTAYVEEEGKPTVGTEQGTVTASN